MTAGAKQAGHRQGMATIIGQPGGRLVGLRNGYRDRFGMYLPPLLEALGLAEVTHEHATTACERPDSHDRRGALVRERTLART